MSSAATTSPSVDKVDGFSRKSVRKAKQKRSQSSSQFRSQGKPIELTPLPLLKGKTEQVLVFVCVRVDGLNEDTDEIGWELTHICKSSEVVSCVNTLLDWYLLSLLCYLLLCYADAVSSSNSVHTFTFTSVEETDQSASLTKSSSRPDERLYKSKLRRGMWILGEAKNVHIFLSEWRKNSDETPRVSKSFIIQKLQQVLSVGSTWKHSPRITFNK